MRLISLFLLAGALLSATPLTTQVTLANAGNPGVIDSNNFYVGPYTLTINGWNVAALCVDFNDESYIGSTWTAYLSQVGGDISDTYRPNDAVQYEEEAYLYSLITQPGADRIDIQHAAWAITDPSFTADSAAQVYVTQAQNNYKSIDFSGYELVSTTTSPHQQEYLIASPEPASLALFATGALLAGIGLVRRRRASN